MVKATPYPFEVGERVELGELSWPRHRDQRWSPGEVIYRDTCEVHIAMDTGVRVPIHKSSYDRLRKVAVEKPEGDEP